MAGSATADRIGTVVETGIVELSGKRWANAGAQFGLAARMCAEADASGRVKLTDVPDEEGHSERTSRSLEKGVRLLLLFTDDAPLWGVKEAAAALKATPSTTHRYLQTWVRLGQLTQDGVAGAKYVRVKSA